MTDRDRAAPGAPGRPGWIEVLGARTHNLRGVDVLIPHHSIVACTGVSGSGKTSLVIDTVHTEAQLRYVEGFEPYVRKFLAPRDRPQVDGIRGLGATLAVDQRRLNRNPNSTLATLTGLDAYLGLLFARLAPLGGEARQFGSAPLHPSMFDSHSLKGRCPRCQGTGEIAQADPDRIVPRPDLPLLSGGSPWFGENCSNEATALPSLARHHGVDLDQPWSELPGDFRHAVLHGTGDTAIEVSYTGRDKKGKTELSYRTSQVLVGALAEVERAYAAGTTEDVKEFYAPFLSRQGCSACGGTGLGEVARGVRLHGRTFQDVVGSRIRETRHWVDEVAAELNPAQRQVGHTLVPELRARLDLLVRLGLAHLQLSRGAPTLSGGELQRARLSAQIGTALTGLTYVLDEPGAGLHPVDKEHLFHILRELRDAGNTVLLVEHDPDLIARADWVIDLGPGAGRHGGELVAAGTPAQVAARPESVTGHYLSRPNFRLNRAARTPDESTEWLVLHQAAAHNVAVPRIRVPLGHLTCLTGVSGSGKSTVLNEILAESVAAALAGRPLSTADTVVGLPHLRWVTVVDQNPIGRTPRSNPATYTKAFDVIRQLFAGTEPARSAGLTASSFSFNSPGGRCEACKGLGQIRMDMEFLGDTWLTCETCDGRRYRPEVLAVTYRGLSIDEVLVCTVEEAAEVFTEPEKLAVLLRSLLSVGLGYLTLGESGTALSGGEAQRLKLAKANLRGGRADDRGLVILDEPLTGLHPADAQRLVLALDLLLERGHTVVIAEHDPHVAASADWIIDLGPGAGDDGGKIINEGTPAHVAAGTGPTAPHLRRLLCNRTG